MDNFVNRRAYRHPEDMECVKNYTAGKFPTEKDWFSVTDSFAIYSSFQEQHDIFVSARW